MLLSRKVKVTNNYNGITEWPYKPELIQENSSSPNSTQAPCGLVWSPAEFKETQPNNQKYLVEFFLISWPASERNQIHSLHKHFIQGPLYVAHHLPTPAQHSLYFQP